MRRFLIIAWMLVAIAGAACAADNTDGYAAQLTDGQYRKLKRIPFRVAVTTYVPAGYRLQSLSIDPDTRFGPSYDIKYAGPRGAYFTVRATRGGIGGPGGERHETVSNPVLGKTTLEIGFEGENGMDRDYMMTEWVGKSPFYGVLSDGVPVAEVKKIYASLRWLR